MTGKFDRAYRGGSWIDDTRYACAVYRYANDHSNRYESLGIRLVEVFDDPESAPAITPNSLRASRGGGAGGQPGWAQTVGRCLDKVGFKFETLGIRLVEVTKEEEKLMSDKVNAWVAEAVRSIDKILHEFGEENFKNKGLHGAIDAEGMARDLIARQPLEAGQCLEGLANLRGPGDRYAKAAYAILTTIFSYYFEADDEDEWFRECRSACPSIDH